MDVRDNLAKSYSVQVGDQGGGQADRAGNALAHRPALCHATCRIVCPHGRPIVLRISIEELDRRFGRALNPSGSLPSLACPDHSVCFI